MPAIYILVLQTLFFWGLVFVLYKLKEKVTLIPLYSYIAILTILTHNLADLGFSIDLGQIHFLISSVTFFTSLMLGVLTLYLFEGPRATRLVLGVILGVSFLYVFIVFLLNLQSDVSGWVMLSRSVLSVYFWSIFAIIIDVLLMVIIWELLIRINGVPLLFKIFAVTIAVYFIDSLIFVTGVFGSEPIYLSVLRGNLFVRLILALIISPIITFVLGLKAYKKSVRDKSKNFWEILNFRSDLESKVKSMEQVVEEERKLAQDLKKFQLAVKYASDHIVITDPDGTILFANDGVERITGFSREEVVGKKAGSKELWGGLMDADFYKKLWQTIKIDKKVFSGEIKNKRKNGQIYSALASISPVLNENNEVSFFVGIERDITKEKELEHLKDEFVSIASHELRTPMTAIKGFASMLLEGDYGKIPDKIEEPLNNIRISTERLIHLVNDLLNLSRIEAGRLKIALEDIDSEKVVKETVDSLSPLAEQRKLILKVGNLESAKVQVDSDKLRQVLTNLIGNSLKFTDTGEISVSQIIDNDFAKISVKDTGIGIPESEKERVFGKFEQIHDDKKGRPQGTGLGLYICKMLIEKMGGRMWLEYSEVGKGSIFSFTLPITGSAKAKETKDAIIKESQNVTDQKEMEPMAQV